MSSTSDLTPAVQSQRFYRDFHDKVEYFLSESSNTQSLSVDEKQAALQRLSSTISELSNAVRDAASFLPSRDQQNYTNTIYRLSETLSQLITSTRPRSKFSFKQKVVTLAPTPTSQDVISPLELSSEPASISMITTSPPPQNAIISYNPQVQISNHTLKKIILPLDSSVVLNNKSGSISNISQCIISLLPQSSHRSVFDNKTPGYLSSLSLKTITKSVLCLGRVNGAVHLTALNDVIVFVSTRQFRIHDSHNATIVLECASQPIIEDCQGLTFVDCRRFADGNSDTIILGEEKDRENLWNQVQDFKWLSDTMNPHWKTSEDEDEKIKALLSTLRANANIDVILHTAKLV